MKRTASQGLACVAPLLSPSRFPGRDAISQMVASHAYPSVFPYPKSAFQRQDESSDSKFYASPRFVTHIDDAAIQSVRLFYGEAVLPRRATPNAAVLDLCSSWISHYPHNYSLERVVGIGMNAEELAGNRVLTEKVVWDLNKEPRLPLEDNSFDAVTNTASVDYLTQPLEVFRETLRVLKPGGLACMSFSNRCFPTKAIRGWLEAKSDKERVLMVASYFHFSGFTNVDARDITGLAAAPAEKGGRGKQHVPEDEDEAAGGGGLIVDKIGSWLNRETDPMYVVFATKPW